MVFYKQYNYLIREDYADYVIDEFSKTLNWSKKVDNSLSTN